ncbi:kinase-like protein [Peniophora sp. CONT]|nr:kinase-like protein [Peniophora sp. CONT]
MAATSRARKRPSAVQIPERGNLYPDVDDGVHSTTTSDGASSDLVPLVARTTTGEDLGIDRIDEQRPFATDHQSRTFHSRQLSTQDAITSTSALKSRTSVRGIAAGLKKVGHRLRRLSNDVASGKGVIAARLYKTAGTGQLPNTRFDIPLVSPAGADLGEDDASYIARTNCSSRSTISSDDGLAPPAAREIGEPARMAGVTVLDDGRVKYQLFAVAGEGGFASVFYAHVHPYLAKDENLFPEVAAVKVFNRSRLATMGISVQHVGEECKALQRATNSYSPFLTHLISTFYDAQNIYAVMHAYAGTLSDRLCDTNRRMPAHEIKQLAAELVVGLQAVNEMGYIHRDLKPDNVFLSPAGHLVVADFTTVINPARRERPGSDAWLAARVRKETRPVGTPFRYAPEQVQLDTKYYTSKVDLWALGFMMLELFRGNCTDSIFCPTEFDEHPGSVDILSKDLRPEINTFVDNEHARRLVRRLLSRDPEARPSTSQIMNDPYFTSGRDQDVKEYWRRIKNGDNPALYYPPKIVVPKANKVELFFKTPEREPALPLEPGFDPTHRAYHYECDESLLTLDDKVYGQVAVFEV